jgi:electron transport complex protein RnfG
MKRNFVMPLLVLTIICVIVSGALALMDNITDPIISAAAAQRTEEAMNVKIPHATGFTAIELDSIDGLPTTIREVYKTANDAGYIFIAVVGGFSGDITVICGIDPDGRIIASSSLSHTETQGIGTIIEKESFLSPFEGIDHRLDGIDTVTGATITTRAYIHAIDDIFTAFHLIND